MFRDVLEPQEGKTSGMRLPTSCKRVIVPLICRSLKKRSNVPIAETKSCCVGRGRNSVIPVAGGTTGQDGIREWFNRVMGKRLSRKLHSLIETHIPTFTFGNVGICTYCGDDANTRDHAIPWSFPKG